MVDRITLNRQIESLIDAKGHDEEARIAIAAFARDLSSSAVSIEGTFRRPGGTVKGQTPGHGLIEIREDRDRTAEFARGVHQERVGYYKLERARMRKEYWITITHFWKADIGTESEEELAEQWLLATDRGGSPVWFGRRGILHIRTLRLFKSLEFEIAREMFEESWGASIGSLHKGSLRLSIIGGA